MKACTGSGKTLAFAIPIIQNFLKEKMKREEGDEEMEGKVREKNSNVDVLVMAPSRELVMQIYKVIQEF